MSSTRHNNFWSSTHVLCSVSHLIFPWLKSPIIIQSPLLTSLMALCIFSLFCLVMLGQRYTTPLVTVVCPVTNLHQMVSLQSASSCNCTSYAGIVSLVYRNTLPPLLPILSFLNITQPSSPNSASVISLFAHDSVILMIWGFISSTIYTIIRLKYVSQATFADCRSQFLLDRLGRCLKLIVSYRGTSSHEFASQFGLAFFLYVKNIHKLSRMPTVAELSVE